jgi:hypothetical protein
LKKYKITNLGLARQFLGIEIHCEKHGTGTGVSLGPKAFITTILQRFNMENAHDVSSPIDPNVNLDLGTDLGEKELNDIKGYQAIVVLLMYAAHATRPNISFAVTALYRYNSCPFTSHFTAANWILQYPKSKANFGLHLSSSSSANSNDQRTRYTHSDWANNSADHKSQ